MAVIVYSIPSCPNCAAAKALLKRKGLKFEEFDVQADKAKQAEMAEKLKENGFEGSGIQLPVLDIEGKVLQGFSKEQIEQALREKGLAAQ